MTARGRSRLAVWPTLLVALACFAVTFEFLALQLQSGHDPALKASAAAPAPAKVRPRRKIIITRVVQAGPTQASQVSSSSGTSVSAPAPVTSSTS